MARTSQPLLPSDTAPADGSSSSKVSKLGIPASKPAPKPPTKTTKSDGVTTLLRSETEISKKRKAYTPKSEPEKKKRKETGERAISNLPPHKNMAEQAHNFQMYYFRRTKPSDAKLMLTSEDHQALTQHWKLVDNDVDKPPLPKHLQRYHHHVWIDVEKTLRRAHGVS